MPKDLQLNLTGTDSSLSEKLTDVRDAAAQAERALREAEDAISGIANDMKTADEAADRLKSSLKDIGESASGAKQGTNSLDESIEDVSVSSSTAKVTIDQMSDSFKDSLISILSSTRGLRRFEDAADESRTSALGLSAANATLGASATATLPPMTALSQALNRVEEEAGDATRSMAGTASMAELLSLKSSALSINVGVFTIALRNLTTQVPLLVTSLGNLVTAFVGVAGAVGAIGIGGLAGAMGGLVAEVERVAGETASMEEKLAAAQAIGEQFVSMLRDAVDPLVEMEGAAALFKNTLENIASTVNVFSQSIADSYEDGPLKEAITNLSDAWMDSVVAIGDAFEYMVEVIGVPISEGLATGIRLLDDFIIYTTNVVDELIQIWGSLTKTLTIDGESISTLQFFFTELTQLGRYIAAGLAPLLQKFLESIGRIARAFNELGPETIATATKFAALALAMNKVLGIASQIARPLGIAAGSIASVANEASSLRGAFSRMVARMSAGLAEISSGFNALSKTVASAVPAFDAANNNALSVAESFDEADSAASYFKNKMGSTGGVISNTLIPALSRAKSGVLQIGNAFVATSIGSELAGQTDSISNSFDELTDNVQKQSGGIANAFSDSIQRVGSTTLNTVSSVGSGMTTIFDKYTSSIGRSIQRILQPVTTIKSKYQTLSDIRGDGFLSGARASLSGFTDDIDEGEQSFSYFVGRASGGLDTLGNKFKSLVPGDLAQSLVNPFGLLSGAATRADGVLGEINSSIERLASSFAGLTKKMNVFAFNMGEKLKNRVASVDLRSMDFQTGNISPEDILVKADVSEQVKERYVTPITSTLRSIPDKIAGVPGRIRSGLIGFGEGLDDLSVDGVLGEINSSIERLVSSFAGLTKKMNVFAFDMGQKLKNRVASIDLRSMDFQTGNISPEDMLVKADVSEQVKERYVTPITSTLRSIPDKIAGVPGRIRSGLIGFGEGLDDLSVGGIKEGISDLGSSMSSTARSTILGTETVSEFSQALTKNDGILGSVGNAMFAYSDSLVEGQREVDALKNAKSSLSLELSRYKDALEETNGVSSRYKDAVDSLSTSMYNNESITSGVKDSYKSLIGVNNDASKSTIALRSGILGLGGDLDALEQESSTLKGSLLALGGSEQIAEDSADQFSDELNKVFSNAEVADSKIEKLEDSIGDLSEGSTFATMTTNQLNEEMREAGISAEVAEQGIDEAGNASTRYSFKATLANLSTKALSSSMLTLGKVLAATTAALLAIGAVVGIAAAGLMVLGSSGMDVKEIISGLKNTIGNLYEALQPLIVALGNAVLDIFDSIVAVGGELLAGFKDIAIALGLMSPAAKDAEGGMSGFISSVGNAAETIKPVVQAIGDMTRIIAGQLIGIIRDLSESIATLVGFINILGIVSGITSLFQNLGITFSIIKTILGVLIGVISDLISGLIKMGVIVGVLTGIVWAYFAGVAAATTVTGALASAVGLLFSPVTGIVLAISGLIVLFERLGVFDAIIAGLGAAFGVLADMVMAVLDPIFSLIAAILGPLITAMETYIGLMMFMLAVYELIFDAAISLVGDLVNLIVGGLMSGINGFIDLIKEGIDIIVNGLASAIGGLAGAFSPVQDALNGIIGGFQAIADAAMAALSSPKEVWDNNIAGDYSINVPGSDYIPKVPDEIGFKVPKLGSSGGGGSGGSSSGGSSNVPEDNNKTGADLGSGGSTLLEMRESEEPNVGGPPPNFEYNEGDTNQYYQQEISADPQDQAQMSRIAKDAMEQANSFARRQQGGQ